ncbi:hypothetical protein ASF48_05035 [Rathayibacter sp. Leaf299]|uniref:hypothetical protein n=1 Tax=Rathayibacter sp. Leaf299 TaxID=1736328 RepID=UPI0006FA344F|nr:hypothetical protein [Rathayibacter sp. Leaf299]KQQ22551.1 hypothetical protein ASF48_05035 [Rathayibacter sp. Leaf299]
MIVLYLFAALLSLFLGILGAIVLTRVGFTVADYLQNVIGYALYGTLFVVGVAALGAGVIGAVVLVAVGIETIA